MLLCTGLASLTLSCRETIEVTTPLTRDCRLNVTFEIEGVPETVGVVGDFNGFDPQVHPLRP